MAVSGKLIKMLPNKYAAILDFNEILNATEAELDVMEDYLVKVYNNMFIQKCDVIQLRQFERLCELNNAHLSIDERRLAVINVYASILPFTLPKMKELLNATCGIGNWIIDDSRLYSNYELKMELKESFSNMLEVVVATLIPFIPAHIAWHFHKDIIVNPEQTEVYVGGFDSSQKIYGINDENINKKIEVDRENILYTSSIYSHLLRYEINTQ